MRLQQYVWNNNLISQLWMLALMARILMAADVPPGPAIEAAYLHVGDVVGHEVVSQAVALIDRAPQLTGLGIERQPASCIADPIRVHAHLCTIGVEFQNI